MADLHLRWIIRRDMAAVQAIEQDSFDFPWSPDDFERCLRSRNTVGMVAELGDTIAGYMIYELHDKRLDLLNFAVRPDFRRRGIGAQMIAKLVGKLSIQRRTRILAGTYERNLPGQLFFRACGFRCISIQHDFFDDPSGDAYFFEWGLAQEAPFSPVNRFAHLA